MLNTILFNELAGKITIESAPFVTQSVNMTERFLIERWQIEPFFIGRLSISATGPVTTVGTVITISIGLLTVAGQVTAYGDYVDPLTGRLGPKTVTVTRLT